MHDFHIKGENKLISPKIYAKVEFIGDLCLLLLSQIRLIVNKIMNYDHNCKLNTPNIYIPIQKTDN